jgi:hypothetical protein
MNTYIDRLTLPERIGVLLIIVGVSICIFGLIACTLQISASTQFLASYLERAGELSEIQSVLRKVTAGLSQGQFTVRLAGIGFMTLLSGIWVYIFSRRKQCKMHMAGNPSSTKE